MGEVVGGGPARARADDHAAAGTSGSSSTRARRSASSPAWSGCAREVFETLDYDTVVVIDSHWFTTVEFVVAAQPVRAGLFTSDELPRGMSRVPYDCRGDPELAHAIAAPGDAHGTWITAIDDPCLPIYYATVNLWAFLGRGLDKQWMTMSNTAETGDTEDFLRAGRALGAAIAATDRQGHPAGVGRAVAHVLAAARAARARGERPGAHPHAGGAGADLERIGWFEAGDHARVLDTMPAYLKVRPEAKFAHYLMMIAALGGPAVTAPGRRFSEYENAIGTGQMHLWFDRPAGGWCGAAMPAGGGA